MYAEEKCLLIGSFDDRIIRYTKNLDSLKPYSRRLKKMKPESIPELFEDTVEAVMARTGLDLKSLVLRETRIAFKSDVLRQIEDYVSIHSQLRERSERIQATLRGDGTVFHGTNTIYLGTAIEEASEDEVRSSLIGELGHVLYNISLRERERERKRENNSLLGKVLGIVLKKRSQHSEAVSKLYDGLFHYALETPYPPQVVNAFAPLANVWLQDPSFSLETIEAYKASRPFSEDDLPALSTTQEELKRFGMPATALAAYQYRLIQGKYSPEQVAASIGHALFDKRIPMDDCGRFIRALEQHYLGADSVQVTPKNRINVQEQAKATTSFPRIAVLPITVKATVEESDDEPDIIFDAHIEAEAMLKGALQEALKNNITLHGGLDGLITDFRFLNEEKSLQFHEWSGTATASRRLTYIADVIYFG